ncbi:MAG TPA: NUDIX domain-containing protein [Candidatus Saccharimonadales bacterium]|nr:NUDIX domain-containing protein [Candidatus Saccharimonadales bacterium]
METKVLIIAVVENGKDEVLLRKKPDGSLPYKETWYLFGATLVPGEAPADALRAHLLKQTGVKARMVEALGWDTEVKADLDGITKQFVYLDMRCSYISGALQPAPDIERLEWVPRAKLTEYDLVPPSRVLFKKLGYLR